MPSNPRRSRIAGALVLLTLLGACGAPGSDRPAGDTDTDIPGRAEYAKLISDHPLEVPLDAKALVAAFDRWDREIGGAKVKK